MNLKIKILNKNQALYFKIFMALILCIVVTILVLSMILYVNFERIAAEQVYKTNTNSLERTSQNVASTAKVASYLSSQVFRDANVGKLLYFKDPSINEISTAINQLYYCLSIPFIDSIYIYNGMTNTIYLNKQNDNSYIGIRKRIQSVETFDDKDALEKINEFRAYKQYLPIPRTTVITSEDNTKKNFYSFISYDIFSGDKLQNAVMVNFSEEWLQESIQEDSEQNSSNTFIIDKSGRVVSNSEGYPILTDISNEKYIQKILHSDTLANHFIDKVRDEKSLITYCYSEELNWIYIRVTPWNNVMGKIMDMKNMTILIGVLILLVGWIISFVVSRRLFVPVKSILTKLKGLEEENKGNIVELRQGILKDIILGRNYISKNNIYDKFEKLDIRMDVDGYFRLILFKIDRYAIFCSSGSTDDIQKSRQLFLDLCDDILSEKYKQHAIDIGEGNLLVIQSLPLYDENCNDRDSLESMLKAIQSAAIQSLNISVSITVSTIDKSVMQLGELYKLMTEASLHKIYKGYSSIIYLSEILLLEQNVYTYPINKEKNLIDALMSNKIDKAKQIYNDILQETSNYPIYAGNLAITHLIFAVNNTINTILRNNSFSDRYEKNTLTPLSVTSVETLDELNEKFYSIFINIGTIIDSKKNTKHEELINAINEIINKYYADYELSLNSIADKLEMTPTYLTMLYKRYTMTTILDRIIEVRMEKAREFLVRTDWAIAEISEKVGFNNDTYFYKVFKKMNGVTPADYRKNFTN